MNDHKEDKEQNLTSTMNRLSLNCVIYELQNYKDTSCGLCEINVNCVIDAYKYLIEYRQLLIEELQEPETALDELIDDLKQMTKNPTEETFEHEGYHIALNSIYWLQQYKKFMKDEPKARVVQFSKNVECCENCGKSMMDVWKYCPDCGKRLIWYGQYPELWEEMGKHDTEEHRKI